MTLRGPGPRDVPPGEVSLRAWTRLALPEGIEPAAHQLALLDALELVAAGKADRLMVLMPPGSAKSTYASVLFPPWWFARHPGSQIIACAHTASLAGYFGTRVRGLIREYSAELGCVLGARAASRDFDLKCGAAYYAAGVQGAVTGRRADLILIDDPIRSHFEAESHSARERLWEWYRSDLLTRLKPKGRIVLIMTRWHEDDLVGRLLAREPDWTSLRLPAIAEADDPLGRAEGCALWPAWEDLPALERKRVLLGEQRWQALYQQNPRPRVGTVFLVDRIVFLDRTEPVSTARGWDLAATSPAENAQADWTVGVKLGREASGRIVILDVVRLQGRASDVQAAIVRTAQRDGPQTRISLPQDPGQAGKYQAQHLIRSLAGFVVQASPETGSKRVRALPVSCQVDAGNVALLRADWNTCLLNEMAEFPAGRFDDQVDALARAFAALTDHVQPAHRTQLGVFLR